MKKFAVIALGALMLGAFLFAGYRRAYSTPPIPSNAELKVVEGKLVRYAPADVLMEADGKRYVLHLAPYWFLEDAGIILKEDDRIKVRGYIYTEGGQSEIIVTEIWKNGKNLRLRDRNGWPLWSRGMRGSGRGRGCCYGRGGGRRW